MVSDLKQFISQKDSDLLKKIAIFVDQKVNEFIKKKIDEWDFVMVSMEMNKEHFHFGVVFEIFLVSMIYKMQINVPKNYSKGLILGTHTD